MGLPPMSQSPLVGLEGSSHLHRPIRHPCNHALVHFAQRFLIKIEGSSNRVKAHLQAGPVKIHDPPSS